MHLFEKQMFICDEGRYPHYALALGTGSGGARPALDWLEGEWTPVRHCFSFNFGREHLGLAIGDCEWLSPEALRPLLKTMEELAYTADYMSMALPEGGLVVLATKRVASSALAVAYSTWFAGRMQVGMSRYCGPVLWFGTLQMWEPPVDLITKIDRYARAKKSAAWGPGRIYLVDSKEFEECDCEVEPELWLEEMQAVKLPRAGLLL